MPFDQGQFEVEFAPAITPAPILPAQPLSRNDAVLDVLREARDFISDYSRWVKLGPNRQGPVSGGACAIHACHVVDNDRLVWTKAAGLLKRALPAGFYGVAHFNDAPTTTHADVLALFDRAIAFRRNSL